MPRKQYKHICDFCGKEHYINSSTYYRLLDGRNKHSYCSIKCKSLSQQTGEQIKCDNCGNTFYRRKCYIERQEHHFCCTDCEFEYKHNQSMEVRKCEVCEKDFECKKISTQRFCSPKCQNLWQTTLTKELNATFISTYTKCEYCGEEYHIPQYKLNNNQHKFCSYKCRQHWYSEVWSQQKEWKDKSRTTMLNTLQSGKISTVTSKPQRIIDNLLNDMKINFIKEYPVDYYNVDIFIPLNNLFIEVQGDYWHCSPIKYPNVISMQQKDRIGRDKRKHTYILNKYNVNILYLWEYDIIHRLDICKSLIKEYINNNGKLTNYNSFNYELEDNKLKLKGNIIIPYQEQNINNYRKLILEH